MSNIGKLLVIGGFAQKLYGRRLLRRAVSRILLVTGLSVVLSILISALLLCGFYAAYHALLASGFVLYMAMLIVVSALTVVCLVLGIVVVSLLRSIPTNLASHSPLGADISQVVDAFLDGLNGEKR